MEYAFSKAKAENQSAVWSILQAAIQRRADEGSEQWQDGYPNPSVLENDIKSEVGYVLEYEGEIAAYCAVLINDEPEYEKIKGAWLSQGDFVVMHRVAVSEKHLGKGLAKKILKSIEAFALENGIYSIKADTNFDNAAMIRIFEKSGYQYCGQVTFRGSPRRAFEKVLR